MYYFVLLCFIVYHCVLVYIIMYYCVLFCIIVYILLCFIVYYFVLLCITVYYCDYCVLLCIIWEDNLIGEQADSSKLPVSVVPTHFKSHSCFRPPVWKLNCISVFSYWLYFCVFLNCISVYFSVVFLNGISVPVGANPLQVPFILFTSSENSILFLFSLSRL